jgi:hypothetical protein
MLPGPGDNVTAVEVVRDRSGSIGTNIQSRRFSVESDAFSSDYPATMLMPDTAAQAPHQYRGARNFPPDPVVAINNAQST